MSWIGRPGSSTTVRAPGSSAVTNIGPTTRYWLGASPRKYTSGVCSSQRAVVGLIDRAGAARVHEQRRRLIEPVRVRVRERRRERERRRPVLEPRAMDAALKRAEAHSRPGELGRHRATVLERTAIRNTASRRCKSDDQEP